jgi:hypothetical protein
LIQKITIANHRNCGAKILRLRAVFLRKNRELHKSARHHPYRAVAVASTEPVVRKSSDRNKCLKRSARTASRVLTLPAEIFGDLWLLSVCLPIFSFFAAFAKAAAAGALTPDSGLTTTDLIGVCHG